MAETEIPADVRELAERYAGRPMFAEVRFTLANAMADAVMADRASRAPDRDALASAQPVKGLEWGSEPPYFVARTAFHTHYSIDVFRDDDGKNPVIWTGGSFGSTQGKYKTVDEAKAAAQADYERRIKSALAPVAEGMVLEGYTFELRYSDDHWSGRMYSTHLPPENDYRNVHKLYRAPNQADGAGETNHDRS